MDSHISKSAQETMAVARKFAKQLKKGDIIFLEGDLGAGKTTFTKGLAEAFGVKAQQVVSPTFVIMNHYQAKLPIYHFDLYRLEKPQEIASVQFDEYFYGDGISIVEWHERLPKDQRPSNFWLVQLKHLSENERDICISYPSKPQQTPSR